MCACSCARARARARACVRVSAHVHLRVRVSLCECVGVGLYACAVRVRETFCCVVTWRASFWSPSRAPTSTTRTRLGQDDKAAMVVLFRAIRVVMFSGSVQHTQTELRKL